MSAKLPSAKFRRQLKEQLPILESEGLLSPQQAQSLTNRYRLDALSAEATHFLLMAIYIISSVLIAIGVISFVAAHWRDIPASIKLAAIFGIMLAAHGMGFYLWQLRQSHPRLGHTLVLLGTLIFGANIGLVAQIFHIRGNPFDMFLAWSIGAIAVGYAVRSVPNAAAAVILAGIYAVGSGGQMVWSGVASSTASVYFLLLIAAVFIPFVYISRSTIILSLLLILLTIIITCFANTIIRHDWLEISDGLLLAGVLFSSWASVSHYVKSTRFISSLAWTWGGIATAISAYFYSFRGYCEDIRYVVNWSQNSAIQVCVSILIVTALGLWLASLIWRTGIFIMLWTAMQMLLFSASIGLLKLVSWQAISAQAMALIFTFMLLLMVALLFAAGFKYEDRRIFWAAVLLAALVIVGRTLEYETGLMVKAAVFIACGVGLMVGGVLFERFLKSRRALHE